MQRFVIALAVLLGFEIANFELYLAADPPSSNPVDQAKKDKDSKPAKEEQQYNSPPKGASLVSLGRLTGRIAKGSDGKTFSLEVEINGKKKEVEINLAAYTKVRVTRQAEFDDKGNPKKSAPVASQGTADDIRGGRAATVTVNGTSDGKWLVARYVSLSGE
jgi:hypothetical protein